MNKEIKIEYDNISEKVFATRIVDGKKFGICLSVKHDDYFYCPHCKTNDFNSIKERKIDGEPEIKSLAYGYGWADTRYGKSYLPIIRGTESRDYPVSVKFLCEKCGNEHTKPELLKALQERDYNFDKRLLSAKKECYQKLSILTP